MNPKNPRFCHIVPRHSLHDTAGNSQPDPYQQADKYSGKAKMDQGIAKTFFSSSQKYFPQFVRLDSPVSPIDIQPECCTQDKRQQKEPKINFCILFLSQYFSPPFSRSR